MKKRQTTTREITRTRVAAIALNHSLRANHSSQTRRRAAVGAKLRRLAANGVHTAHVKKYFLPYEHWWGTKQGKAVLLYARTTTGAWMRATSHMLRVTKPHAKRFRLQLGMCTLLLTACLGVLDAPSFQLPPARSRSGLVFQSCTDFLVPIDFTEGEADGFPKDVLMILSSVDHIFIIAAEHCSKKLPRQFLGRATCVIGKRLDACAPKAFIRRPYRHAMKVSFSHAAVLELAHVRKYPHVAIIEDDVFVQPRAHSDDFVNDFHGLLRSNAWSMIRFGYRPYFLEESSRGHCPRVCRCRIKQRIAKEFCELSRAGCDLRSSDFYIIRGNFYLQLQSAILDMRQTNSKRVIDTLPMRQLKPQWLILPQLSVQATLDIPIDYQFGLGALYVTKCVFPRPLDRMIMQQLSNSSRNVEHAANG